MKALRIISVLLFYFTADVAADISIQYDLQTEGARHPYHALMLKENLIRIDQPGPRSATSVLIDTTTGDIVQLDNPSRQFFRINARTIDEYVEFYRRNKSLLKGLIDHGLSQATPQQRKQVEQMMEQYEHGRGNSMTIQSSTRKDLVLGARCRMLQLREHDRLISEICLTAYDELGLGPDDIAGLEQLKTFVQQFKRAAPRQHRKLFTLVAQNTGEFSGVPLKVINYRADGEIDGIIEASSISVRSIPPQAYRIPDHYRQQSVPLL